MVKSDIRKASLRLMSVAMLMALGNGMAYAADPSQEFLKKFLTISPNRQMPLPEEVIESLPFGVSIGTVWAMNHFPFGENQAEYVKLSKIKSIALNVREVRKDGTLSPTVAGTITLRFNSEGLIENIRDAWTPPKSATYDFAYASTGIVRSIQLNHGYDATVSVSPIPNYVDYVGALDASPESRRLMSKLYFNSALRLSDASDYQLLHLIHSFVYDPEGNLVKINEDMGFQASLEKGGDTKVVTSVKYQGDYPVTSSILSKVGAPQYYLKYNPNEYLFDHSATTVEQHRDHRDEQTGQVKTRIMYSYDAPARIIEAATIVSSGDGPARIRSVKIERNSAGEIIGIYETTPETFNGHFGYKIVKEAGRVRQLRLASPIMNGRARDSLFDRIFDYVYRGTESKPFRIRVTVDKDHVASMEVDPNLTTYVE
jgi:hypothetical protein